MRRKSFTGLFKNPLSPSSSKKEALVNIKHLKSEAIKLLNQYMYGITQEQKYDFMRKVISWKKRFLAEAAKISKDKAKEYEYLGMVDETPFKTVQDSVHRQYLSIILRYSELCDLLLDEYSRFLKP